MQLQRDSQDILPTQPGVLVGGKRPRTSDMTLGGACSEGRDCSVYGVSLDQEIGDVAR